MTVLISQNARFLRTELDAMKQFMRDVKPGLVRTDFANLVTNGGFGSDTIWTKGTGWTISAGVANAASGTASNLDQLLTVKAGRSYRLTSTYTVSASSFTPSLTGTTAVTGTAVTAGGTVSATLVANATSTGLRFAKTATTVGTIDNVSIYEADPADDAPWLRLPYGWEVGKSGWIVRDGETLHPSDYAEITQSGQTWIKPGVAPGADTEFSIWGAPS